jgi:glucokinase
MLSRIEKIEFMHLFEGADRQDQLAQIVLEDCLKAWGLCAVNMVHAYDPDVIVIGGGIMQRKEDILPPIQKMVDEYAWLEPGTVQVVAAEQVEFAGLLGMDCLVSKLKKEH